MVSGQVVLRISRNFLVFSKSMPIFRTRCPESARQRRAVHPPPRRDRKRSTTSAETLGVGVLAASQLREEMRTAIRGLGPGQISRVFRLPSGFATDKIPRPEELTGIKLDLPGGAWQRSLRKRGVDMGVFRELRSTPLFNFCPISQTQGSGVENDASGSNCI